LLQNTGFTRFNFSGATSIVKIWGSKFLSSEKSNLHYQPETYYPGAPHGLTATHQDQVNADLLAFLKA
jgi:hypothetical protein